MQYIDIQGRKQVRESIMEDLNSLTIAQTTINELVEPSIQINDENCKPNMQNNLLHGLSTMSENQVEIKGKKKLRRSDSRKSGKDKLKEKPKAKLKLTYRKNEGPQIVLLTDSSTETIQLATQTISPSLN